MFRTVLIQHLTRKPANESFTRRTALFVPTQLLVQDYMLSDSATNSKFKAKVSKS